MAQRAVSSQQHEQIDWCLQYQFGCWTDVQEMMDEWLQMDVIGKEVFQLEWCGITEHWLAELRHWATQDLLSAEQRAQYDRLMHLVDRHNPRLQALFADDTP